MIKSRIGSIDGLRAFSALGVVWIHSWSACGNPTLNFFSIDIYQILAIVGNGVDFFFVISGFCMYLMIDKKAFGLQPYIRFIYKRFLRIAPAFFTSVLVYAVIAKCSNPAFSFWYPVIFHFLFLNNIFFGNIISAPFWSIGVEWHFYLLLPLFILFIRHISVLLAVMVISLVCLSLFCLIIYYKMDVGWWQNQVVTRFPEFGCGIIASDAFLKKRNLPKIMQGIWGLVASFGIMYLGRLMMFTPVLNIAGNFSFLLKAFSYTIMTAGFALLLFHVISIRSLFSSALSTRVITYVGRISYSIYIWHSLSFILLANLLVRLHFSFRNPFVAFMANLCITIPIAHLSYKILESYYFKKISLKNDAVLIHVK